MNRVSADATAFHHRTSEIMILCPIFLSPNATDGDIQKALQPWENIEKLGNGSYVNFLSMNTEEEIAAVYPKDTYDRLVTIKKTYDPENVFQQNYNIKPV